ncbi:MAG: NOG1 family protein [Candidatus Helarchaeota archaeon]
MNPFKITYIPFSQELLDISFHKSSKLNLRVNPKFSSTQKARIREIKRITNVSQIIVNKIAKIIKTFPTFEKLHPFYYELTNILVEVRNVKNLLASLNGIIEVIENLKKKSIRTIRKLINSKEIGKERVKFYGRISSIIYKLDSKLEDLRKIRRILIKLPSVTFDIPTIVVAGYPNVGKSSLVKQISTAKPKIDYYPFTTKSIKIGFTTYKGRKIQILDTPGLLDRELSKRNKIELQAIIALKYLATKIAFIIDPTESCGYTLTSQINLYQEICNVFSEIPIIIVFNKMDLISNEKLEKILENEIFKDDIYGIIATQGEGIPELIDVLFNET